MFDVVCEASRSLVINHNDFWLLSALTDSSYEEGATAADFCRAVGTFADAGVPLMECEKMRAGINGMLEREFRALGIAVKRNPR